MKACPFEALAEIWARAVVVKESARTVSKSIFLSMVGILYTKKRGLCPRLFVSFCYLLKNLYLISQFFAFY